MQAERISDQGAASAELRRTMVDCQVRTFDVTDQVLLARMMEVPREQFLPRDLAPFAYSDANLEIRPGSSAESHRVLPAPLVLARLLQSAEIGPTDKVLDVGSGGGYVAALLAGLCDTVVTLESDRLLHEFTRSNLNAYGLSKVETIFGPLDRGVPDKAPFDVVIVNGAFEAGLGPLLSQLKNGGRLAAISRAAEDPTGRAGKAVLYENVEGSASFRTLFDAAASVLADFRKPPEFTFA
jgi:protein-L-isoaspartate(D-aspartate) O-methyltransferase